MLGTPYVTHECPRSSDAGLMSLHVATLPDRGREGSRGSWPGPTRHHLRRSARKSAVARLRFRTIDLRCFGEDILGMSWFEHVAFTTGSPFMRLAKNTFAAIVAASWFVVAHAGAQTPPNPAPLPAASPPPAGAAPAPQPTQPTQTTPMQPVPSAGQPIPMPGQQPVPGQTGATPQGQPGQPQGMDGQTYAIRLRDLEQRIDELKEQIRRSHTRLSLLSDTILAGGSGGGSRAIIKFSNEISTAWKISKLLVVLDGSVQYSKTEQQGVIADAGEVPVFTGTIPPGAHTVQVLVNLTGTGFGVFSYLKGYKFEIRSDHSFTAIEGKTTNLQVISFEKGGATARFEERPAVRYGEKVTQGLGDLPGATTPGAAR